MKISLQALMDESGVKFGTSGARGLAHAMTDRLCYAYTKGFLQYLDSAGEVPPPGSPVAVAGDLRPSTGRIMEAVCRAVEDTGRSPVNCGRIPSPALALHGLTQRCPAVMVTGSHIPEDRNGIKFNKPTGEILKEDETGIRRQVVEVAETLFHPDGTFRAGARERLVHSAAREAYVRRYLDFFPQDCLHGLRLGVYQHSAVGRELLLAILNGLGATTVPLGYSDHFVPVDTEAIRPQDVQLARHWAAEQPLDAIASTDGDSDRPLLSDEQGAWLRGDVTGILCARFLGATSVSLPVSCNTAVERSGFFRDVRRTRIGSPFVIASMQAAIAAGESVVVGYEANGGFLVGSDIERQGKPLRALPTRDAMIVLLGVLLLARQERKSVGALTRSLPPRFTASDRLKDFPTEQGQAILERFTTGDPATDARAIEAAFGRLCGRLAAVDRTDGLRLVFAEGEIIHLRPSGNAPEFRCYTEAASPARADELNAECLQLLRRTSAER